MHRRLKEIGVCPHKDVLTFHILHFYEIDEKINGCYKVNPYPAISGD